MIFLLGTTAVQAVATTFPFAAIMKVFGSYQHVRQGSVHWGVTANLLIGSLPGTVAGVFIISFLVDRLGDEFNDWLKVVIGLLLLVSIGLSHYADYRRRVDPPVTPPTGRNLKAIAGAAFCGIIIGGSSVGGGSLLIVVMMVLYRITPAQVVGTSIAVSLVLMIVGTIGFWREGLADLTLAWHLAIGGVPGVVLGSAMTMRLSPQLLSRIVALAVGLAGLSLAASGVMSLAGGM